MVYPKFYKSGKSIDQIPIHLRSKEGLGYLPQQRSVFNMSVYDNIMGIAQISIKGLENQKAVTEKLLDEFNLQHLRTLNASVLSGGEIRRLMMARVMINKPKIVLLDEPLAALDPLVTQDIQKYILKIQSSGTAIIIKVGVVLLSGSTSTFYVNRTVADDNTINNELGVSNITLMEVAA